MAAETIGVVAAALQFADVALKAAKLARDIYSRTDAAPVQRSIAQLEAFTDVSNKIAASWQPSVDDPLMERILNQCTTTVESIMVHLNRINMSPTDGLASKTKRAVVARWEAPEVAELFDQLQRDQMSLLIHRSFSQQYTQQVVDSLKGLLEGRLDYASAQTNDEQMFLDAVFVTDPRDDRSTLVARKGRRVEDTCTWVTETDVYRTWLSTTTSSAGLLIEGGPGKGKSMIAIFLTEQLEQLASMTVSESVIYFFCDNRNPKQNNAAAILRCLIWQLCRLRPALIKHGATELRTRGGRPQSLFADTATTIETLWRIFLNMIADDGAGVITCVIDGLDECDDESTNTIKEKFEELLAEWKPATGRSFRLIILSRPPQVHHRALLRDVPRIKLDPDSDTEVHRDVAHFIRERVRELSMQRQYSDALRTRLEKVLGEKAGGTFLWVGFVIQDLRGKSSDEVLKYLETVPLGLNGIYDRILRGVPREHREKVRSLLWWLCLAHHPLTPVELGGLLDASTDASDLDGKGIGFYLGLCSHLIAHGKQTTGTTGTIHLVHQSATDYFLRSEPHSASDIDFFRGSPESTHEALSNTCLDILIRHFQTKRKSTTSKTRSASVDYAAAYWTYHLQSSGRALSRKDTLGKAMQFLERGSSLRKQWISQYLALLHDPEFAIDTISLPHDVEEQQLYGIGLAVPFGLEAVVRDMLQHMSYPTYFMLARTMKPLHMAIANHLPRIVEAILERFGRRALFLEKNAVHVAVQTPDTKSLGLLLKYGADISRPFGDQGQTPLHIAADRGHLDIAAQLLEAMAPVNAPNNKSLTPLHIAVDGFMQTAMVDLLLRHGADVNATDRYGETPLLKCVDHQQNINVFQTLLKSQADVHIKSNAGWTAAAQAARFHHIEMVKLLVEYGANPNDRLRGNGDTVILEVAKNVDPTKFSLYPTRGFDLWSGVLDVLIQHGGDLNRTTDDGNTALHVVASRLNTPDVDPDSMSLFPVPTSKLSPEQFAFLERWLQLLIEKGMDEEARNKEGKTARDIFPYHEPASRRQAPAESTRAENMELYPDDRFENPRAAPVPDRRTVSQR